MNEQKLNKLRIYYDGLREMYLGIEGMANCLDFDPTKDNFVPAIYLRRTSTLEHIANLIKIKNKFGLKRALLFDLERTIQDFKTFYTRGNMEGPSYF
jgi:hypothetical protein